MSLELLMRMLPKEAADEAGRCMERLTEIRIRTGRAVQLVAGCDNIFCGPRIEEEMFRRMLMGLMNHSYYARERELAEGFFTMRDGCRVGVCGSYSEDGGRYEMRAVGSMCVRVAREVHGCGAELVERLLAGGNLRSALLISRPGMGKTTMLRDAARLLSDRGFAVGIADERHEIAACRDGVPTLSVGERTDVADGCPKYLAMEKLIRTMAPQVIVTDEIGGEKDAEAVCEAVQRGVAVLASAHGNRIGALAGGQIGELMRRGFFSLAVLLDGAPGRVADVREMDGAAGWS